MDTSPLILNMMLGRGRGGIEQCFIDYCRMLHDMPVRVLAVVDPRSPYISDLIRYGIPYRTVRVNGLWDIWAYVKLYYFCKQVQPQAIICHGNRALAFAPSRLSTIINVCHNYLVKRIHKVDHFFAITNSMRDYLIKLGVARKKIYVLPNVYDFTRASLDKSWHTPVTIGTLGRFVHKKGYDVFIRALAILRQKGLPFQAILAGDGPLRGELESLSLQSHLGNQFVIQGWVQDKDAFFDSIDIFCLPSREEPFGITLLEAMARKKAIVATNTDGPRHIFDHEADALLIDCDQPTQLADALQKLLLKTKVGQKLAQAAYKKFRKDFTLQAGTERLMEVLFNDIFPKSQNVSQRNTGRPRR